jgi:hypothetical protein
MGEAPTRLDVILRRRESLERERVNCAPAFIATVGGIFDEMPRQWGMVLQINNSNRLMIHTRCYIG